MAKPETKNRNEPEIAYTVEEVAQDAKVGRTTIYSEIKAGNLKARKVGRRTIIIDTDKRCWLASLPMREVA